MLDTNNLDELEEVRDWAAAYSLIESSASSHPEEDEGIRVAFFCWYMLVESQCLDGTDGMDFDAITQRLRTTTAYLLDSYSNSPGVNFYLGYMGSIAAWFFSDSVDEWEEKSEKMLEFASAKEPRNPIYQMVYLGQKNENKEKYTEYCKHALPKVKKLYSGSGEFNDYFRQVLSRKP